MDNFYKSKTLEVKHTNRRLRNQLATVTNGTFSSSEIIELTLPISTWLHQKVLKPIKIFLFLYQYLGKIETNMKLNNKHQTQNNEDEWELGLG